MSGIKSIIKIIAVIAGLFAALAVIISYITYRFTFYNPNKKPDDPHRIPDGPKYACMEKEIHELIDETLAIPYENVSITSRDGLRLCGKQYRTSKETRVTLLMHGWHGVAVRDFAGGVQVHLDHGDNVLLVDQRAHNMSQGHTITFGVKERYDCLDWIEYIRKEFGKDVPILLHGVSMGASTVMMAAGLDLPSNVKGIIADSGYTSPKDIICKVTAEKKINPRIAWPFIRLGALLFGRFDPNAASALDSMRKNHLPLLIIHGTGDDFVPFEMGVENYNASKSVKFFTRVEGAPHVMAYMYDTEQYFALMDEFYNAIS